jgi:hypothetical protein
LRVTELLRGYDKYTSNYTVASKFSVWTALAILCRTPAGSRLLKLRVKPGPCSAPRAARLGGIPFRWNFLASNEPKNVLQLFVSD